MSQTQQLSPAGSLERLDQQKEEKTKSRRPPTSEGMAVSPIREATGFHSIAKILLYRPILTPKTVLPLFYVVGLLFALFGGLMLWASSEVQELSIDYTSCGELAPLGRDNQAAIPASRVVSHFSTSNQSDANSRAVQEVRWSRESIQVPIGNGGRTRPANACYIQFYIPNQLLPPVYLYYRLTNFYQNHRRYVKSLDIPQLEGNYVSNSSISSSTCDPLQLNGTGFAYYPCGLIANSMFNDTISTPVEVGLPSGNVTYNMTNQGIGWSSDGSLYGQTSYKANEVAPPPDWMARYPDGYNDEFPIPDLHTYEEFWVWMRTAGLPTFSKLARQNTVETMSIGTYIIVVYDDFPAQLYDGTKELLLSTRTILGGKNPFLGIAYIVVAGICILLGAIFTVMVLIKPRKLGDHKYLSWNNEQPPTATATGRSLRPDGGN